MKTRVQLCAVVLAVAVGMLTPTVVVGEAQPKKEAEKIDKLLQQRRDTLRQLVKVVTVEYQQGISGFESVYRASDQLIGAELDLAKNAEARIAILQRRVELMKNLFSLVDAKHKAGQGTTAQLLTAKAALLEAQIDLLREQVQPMH
jgi:outer membrane protein TolC